MFKYHRVELNTLETLELEINTSSHEFNYYLHFKEAGTDGSLHTVGSRHICRIKDTKPEFFDCSEDLQKKIIMGFIMMHDGPGMVSD